MTSISLLILTAALWTGPVDSVPWAPVDRNGGEAAGIIRGRVVLEDGDRRPRRRARRYAGGTAPAAVPQSLPTVVWLRGPSDPGAVSGTATLAQKDTIFSPNFVAVRVGGRVVFPNEDDFFHNVFSYTSGARFDLGAYPRGESREVVFDSPGLVRVFCEVHDRMRAAVLVTSNPFHAVVDEGGAFEFTGVPEGSWTLVAWNAGSGEQEVEVEVREGAVVVLDVPLG